jgi:hypothetical protein
VVDSVENVNISYRSAITSSARMIGQSMAIGLVLDQVATGHMDVGRAALLLSTHLLYEAASIYTLYTRYGALLAAKASHIASNIAETASTAAHTVAEGARAAALGVSNTVHGIAVAIKTSSIAQDAALVAGAIAHAIAEGARQVALWSSVAAESALALASGIANAVASMGIAVPIMIAAAAAITAGVLAATGRIPTHERGGLVSRKSITWVAEEEPELIIPISRFNEFIVNSSQRLNILRSVGVHETESLPAFRQGGIISEPTVALIAEEEPEIISPISRFNQLVSETSESTVSNIVTHHQAFASGGLVTRPTVALVAEHEPEAIVPISHFHEFISEKIRDLTFAVSYSMPHLEVQVPSIIAEGVAATAAGIEGLGFYRKASPLEFLTGPLAGARETESKIINIYIQNPSFRTRGDMDALVDRLKRMGCA